MRHYEHCSYFDRGSEPVPHRSSKMLEALSLVRDVLLLVGFIMVVTACAKAGWDIGAARP